MSTASPRAPKDISALSSPSPDKTHRRRPTMRTRKDVRRDEWDARFVEKPVRRRGIRPQPGVVLILLAVGIPLIAFFTPGGRGPEVFLEVTWSSRGP
ncbi:MAG: hypothetical protein MZV63_14350 [Marinilabiliales bacterium]|nr:hypothetical protein [Marinilabiliales bacterium]